MKSTLGLKLVRPCLSNTKYVIGMINYAQLAYLPPTEDEFWLRTLKSRPKRGSYLGESLIYDRQAPEPDSDFIVEQYLRIKRKSKDYSRFKFCEFSVVNEDGFPLNLRTVVDP